MVKYSKKRTLSSVPLLFSIKFLIHEDISSKIELKLDSMEDKNIEVEVEEDEDKEKDTEEEEEVVEIEEDVDDELEED